MRPLNEFHSVQLSTYLLRACYTQDTWMSSLSAGSGCFQGRQQCMGRSGRLKGLKNQSRFLGTLPHFWSFCWLAALLSVISSAALYLSGPRLFLLLSLSVEGIGWEALAAECAKPHVPLKDLEIRMGSETYEEWANNESTGSSRERRISEYISVL